MKKLSVLVPVYNEEAVLHLFYDEIVKVMDSLDNYSCEVVFINDGSSDNSENIIKELRKKDKRIVYITLSRNFGKEIAMLAGFDYINADFTVIMDCDLQDPPTIIKDMLVYSEMGYDDVYAKRKSREGESFLKKKTSKMYYRVLKKFSDIPIQEDTGDFRMLSRRMVNALKQYRESDRYTKGFFSLVGYKKKEILFDRHSRAAGKTKWNYFKLTRLAINGITSFTNAPLRFATVLGIAIIIFCMLYIAFIVIGVLISGIDVPGYASLITVTLFLGSVQLISIGLLGEYIGRIFNQTKNRPPYLIDEINGEKIDMNAEDK